MVCSVAGFSNLNFMPKPWNNLPEGFEHPISPDGNLMKKRPRKPSKPIVIETVDELKSIFKKGYRVQDLDVRGDVASLLLEPVVHPVVRALYERKLKSSQPGNRPTEDSAKIAIAIEGGGMRGCVAAGMITVRT